MAEWFVENGIGEDRAIRVVRDSIVAARVQWPGEFPAGAIAPAVLIAKRAGATRGTGRLPDGSDVLVDGLPGAASEGTTIAVEVTRARIAEPGRTKPAQARHTTARPKPPTSLSEALRAHGESVRIVERFPISGWSDLIADAMAGEVAFDGGTVILAPTPAMTLLDIDGILPAARLAHAAIPTIAHTLPRMAIGGSIGIDFPTLDSKADRKAIDAALRDALSDWPHERTAMNGFGFVHLVARATGPSLLQRARWQVAHTAARLLLRRAEQVAEPGAILLSANPRVLDRIEPSWLFELARRTGRETRLNPDANLALHAGFAQAVPR